MLFVLFVSYCCCFLLLSFLLIVVVLVLAVALLFCFNAPRPHHQPFRGHAQATVGDLPLMQMTQAFDDTSHVEHHVLLQWLKDFLIIS